MSRCRPRVGDAGGGFFCSSGRPSSQLCEAEDCATAPSRHPFRSVCAFYLNDIVKLRRARARRHRHDMPIFGHDCSGTTASASLPLAAFRGDRDASARIAETVRGATVALPPTERSRPAASMLCEWL